MEAIRILVIEDDEDDELLLREALSQESKSFRLEVARSLAEGLARLAEGRAFDLALVDVSLPDASGLDTVRRVRAAAPGLPILVLTGLEDSRFAAGAGRAGASDYIVKGQLPRRALARALRQAVERERLESDVRRRSEELDSLRREDALRREFLANVSHELRTPIAAIKGAVETLSLGGWEDARNRADFIGIIRAHSDRLSEFVEELLLITELDAGPRERTAVALSSLVRSELEKLRPRIEAMRLRVRVDVPESVVALGDEKHLGEAVGHLLSNAVEYNHQGGRLDVDAERRGGEVVLTVVDTGIGVPKRDLERIFERFHRVPRARVLRPHAAGLGLFIVSRVVRAYGGRVWAESGDGRGSSFHVALPAA